MFSIHCPVHGADVLLSERRIRGIERDDAGVRVRYQCWCGHHGSFATGRRGLAARPWSGVS